MIILAAALALIAAVVALLARALLPRAKGTHAGPRQPARIPLAARLAALLPFRSTP